MAKAKSNSPKKAKIDLYVAIGYDEYVDTATGTPILWKTIAPLALMVGKSTRNNRLFIFSPKIADLSLYNLVWVFLV